MGVGQGYAVDPDVIFTTSLGFGTMRRQMDAIQGGLVGDLGRHAKMAGWDAAGKIFASVYDPAAQATLNGLASSTTLMHLLSVNLMTMARNYLAADDPVAAEILAKQPGGPDQVEECEPQRLPETIDEENWLARVIEDPIRGSVHKSEESATTWGKAATLIDGVTQSCGSGLAGMVEVCQGPAVEAFATYFGETIGYNWDMSEVSPTLSLMANLGGACRMLQAACHAYSDLLHHAQRWDPLTTSPYEAESHFARAVASNHAIRALADIPGSFGEQAVKMPGYHGPPSAPTIPGIPAVPEIPGIPAEPEIPVPATVLESVTGFLPEAGPPWNGTYLPPVQPPNPPPFGVLSPAEQAAFTAWAQGLEKHGYAGGSQASLAAQYQERVAGYPEYDLPIGGGQVVQADGLRSTDGAIVDAKYVNDPNSGCTFRTLEKLQNPQPWMANSHRTDREELWKYGQALSQPGSQTRFVEVDTNGPESVAYWNFLLAEQRVKGYARYVP